MTLLLLGAPSQQAQEAGNPRWRGHRSHLQHTVGFRPVPLLEEVHLVLEACFSRETVIVSEWDQNGGHLHVEAWVNQLQKQAKPNIIKCTIIKWLFLHDVLHLAYQGNNKKAITYS